MDITEKNELLARYWGYKKVEELEELTEEKEYLRGHFFIEQTPEGKATQLVLFDPSDLLFNGSFEWLMATVVKIESEGYVFQLTRTKDRHFAEFRAGEGPFMHVVAKGSADAGPNGMLNAIYDAVVECVKIITRSSVASQTQVEI